MSTPHLSRSIDLSIEIDAPFDAVWSALTDAKELTNWFPLVARVTPPQPGIPELDDPGRPGSIWMSWGDEFQFESPIEVWQPFKRLRIVQSEPTSDGPMANSRRVTVEYQIESRGADRSRLVLIHTGFPATSEMDEIYDSTARGWRFQLDGLKLYLERFRGADETSRYARKVVYARCRSTKLSREDLWKRLAGSGGLGGADALDRMKGGETFRITIGEAIDHSVSGIVQLVHPPKEVRGTVDSPGEGLLRLHIDDFFGTRNAYLWISMFKVEEEIVSELQRAADEMMKRI